MPGEGLGACHESRLQESIVADDLAREVLSDYLSGVAGLVLEQFGFRHGVSLFLEFRVGGK